MSGSKQYHLLRILRGDAVAGLGFVRKKLGVVRKIGGHRPPLQIRRLAEPWLQCIKNDSKREARQEQRKLIQSALDVMNQAYKNCQSCGMPVKRDENGGGTNADGTRSTMYCSHCYQNGQFVLPDISVSEMQARVREKIVEFGMAGFLAGIFTRKIPKLARWQKA